MKEPREDDYRATKATVGVFFLFFMLYVYLVDSGHFGW